jgi:hypothetical protein
MFLENHLARKDEKCMKAYLIREDSKLFASWAKGLQVDK